MEINPSELIMHRLNSLAFNPPIWRANSLTELKKMRKKYLPMIHPDKFPGLPPSQVNYLTELFIEVDLKFKEKEKELKIIERRFAKKDNNEKLTLN